MKAVADRFDESQPATARDIAEATDLPEPTVEQMLERLEQEKLLHRVEREGGGVTLAMPPERIHADRLIEIGFDLVEGGSRTERFEFLSQLRAAQRTLASERTLASITGG
jgi:DNA-binding IscR family transcriptional regulator